MKLFAKLFGDAVAEIRPAVARDQQCPTCKSFLEHSKETLAYAGQTFCKQSCVPPSLIAAEEERVRTEKIQADQIAQAQKAASEQTRLQHLRDSENWIWENIALLRSHGLSPEARLKEIHKALHPYSRRYLPPGATCFAVPGPGGVISVQPTE